MKTAEDIIIFGTGNFSRLVYHLAIESGFKVHAFCSDTDFPDKETSQLAPFVPFDQLIFNFDPSRFGITLGFIGKDLQDTRESKFLTLKNDGYHFPNIVQKGSCIPTETLGSGNIVFSGVSVGFQCKIGNCNIMWQNVAIPHDNTVGDFNNFGPNSSLAGYASAGNHCFFGAGVSVNNAVRINDYALIGANAFARKDVGSGDVLVAPPSYVLEGKRSSDFA